MQTVWILAKNHSAAMAALKTAAADVIPYGEDIVTFRFIGSARQVMEGPSGEAFVAVRNWRQRPDAGAVLQAIRQKRWEFYTLREIFL